MMINLGLKISCYNRAVGQPTYLLSFPRDCHQNSREAGTRLSERNVRIKRIEVVQ